MNLEQDIRKRLQAFEPKVLILKDQSALHAGHSGNQGGGHFILNIVSSHFSGIPRIKRHRMIYAALEDLLPHKIHALSIEAFAPEESPGENNR